jgi:adenylate cyclase
MAVSCAPLNPGDDEIVAFLRALGADPDEVSEALHDDRLWELTVDVLLAMPRELTAVELAEQAGVRLEEVPDLLRALGHPEPDAPATEVVYAQHDAGVVAAAAGVARVFPDPETGLRLLRVMGLALARMADAAVAAYVAEVEGPMTRDGASLVEHARSQAEAIARLKDLSAVLPVLLGQQSLQAVRRGRTVRRYAVDHETVQLSVGFVDLVGFTSLSGALSPAELSRVIADFESRAFDIVTRRGGQVIKHIGDEVMFVAFDAPAACDIGLALVQEFAPEADVTPRGGLAFGSLLSRDGDYYGSEVNLAARLADIAVPNEILASSELRRYTEKATEDFAFEPAGRRQLKGFNDPIEVYSLSRP